MAIDFFELLNSLIDQIPSPCYWQNEQGIIAYCNNEFLYNLGLENQQDILQHTLNEFLIESNAEQISKKNHDVLSSCEGVLIQERYATPEHGSFSSLSYKIPLVIANNILGLLNICLSPEKLLHEKENDISTISIYLNNIINNMPGSVYWKDKNGIFLGCNEFVVKMAEVKNKKEIIGKSDYELIWKDVADQIRQNDMEIMYSRQQREFEELVSLGNSKEMVMLTNKAPLFDSDGRVIGVLGVSVDISHRKRVEKALQQEKIKADAANKAKSEFIANMSHDIRTPLAGLLGMAQAIQSDTSEKKVEHDADLLITCAEELLNLLNEIIELVQIESGNVQQREEVFSLHQLVEHNKFLLIPAAKHKNLLLEAIIDVDVPNYMYGNKVLIDRILLNLLSNAIKFTERGSVSLYISYRESGNILVIEVKDTGIGIPKDKMNIIFENFSRIVPSYKGIYKGSGLGLYTVKNYLELLKGDIHVESEVGEGSCFTATIPISIAEPADIKKQRYSQLKSPIKRSLSDKSTTSSTKNEKDITLGETRILLVEDQVIPAKVAMNILDNLNCYIDHVDTGKGAINKLKSNSFDLILMDIGLPDIDGLETTRQIRALKDTRKAKTPIIALTAHMIESKRQECLDAGMQEMLIKPITLLAAKDIIERYVFPDKELDLSTLASIKDHIDFEQSINLANGNEDIAKELLDELAKTLPQSCREIHNAYNANDKKRLYKIVHRVFGFLCYCGLPKLQQIGKEFHELLQKDEPDSKMLEQAYRNFCKTADDFLQTYARLRE